jgi:hypothetical protein
MQIRHLSLVGKKEDFTDQALDTVGSSVISASHCSDYEWYCHL